MGINEKILLIRRNDFLVQLGKDDYELLNVVHNFVEAPKGQYIYFDAHHLNKIFFLKEGYVKIGSTDEAGNEIIKDIIHPGDIFGQFTLDRENNMLGEFARAHKSDVAMCAFSIADFEKLLVRKPEMAIRYSKIVGQKLRKVEFRIINLLQKDVRTRLLHFLWALGVSSGSRDGDTVCIPNFLTHEDIARLIGSSRQTVTTLLNTLEDEVIVKVTRREVVLLKPDELQKAVNVL